MTYAKDTSVSVEKTMAEIQTTLKRYGATRFGLMDEGKTVAIAFEMAQRRVRFTLHLPERGEFRNTDTGRARTAASVNTAYDQAIRAKWRSLLLVIKAKLESVESGIETFDDAFLPQILLPGQGATVSEWINPQIAKAYRDGTMPLMLASG